MDLFPTLPNIRPGPAPLVDVNVVLIVRRGTEMLGRLAWNEAAHCLCPELLHLWAGLYSHTRLICAWWRTLCTMGHQPPPAE